MVMLSIKLTPAVWEDYEDKDINERIRQIPYVINAYRIPDFDITHILLMGFRDMDQKDKYLIKMQTKFAKEIEIKNVYPFSVDRIITQSPVGMLYEILDKKEFPMHKFILPRGKKEIS